MNKHTEDAAPQTTESKFYLAGEAKEMLTATTIEEAVQEFVEALDIFGDPIPEYVDVQGFSPATLSRESGSFDYCVEHLIECLDENYGPVDDPSDYELSDTAKQLFDAFANQVVSEYPVWTHYPNGEPVRVKVSDYVDCSQ